MRKVFVIFFIILFQKISVAIHPDNLINIREKCLTGIQENNYSEIENLLKQPGNNSPVYKGYEGISYILRARNSISPIEKIRYFYKGKRILEEIINTNNGNIELRYIRFCVQTNAPLFLCYNNNIESDKKFIINNWHRLHDEDLKKRIKKIMTVSEHCSTTEKLFFIDG